MMLSTKPLYSVAGSVGTDDISGYVIVDKKNLSIHIHFYGKIFGSVRKPILVKHSNTKFPDDVSIDLIKRIVIGEFANKKVQIKRVTAEKTIPAESSKPQQRTIIRFRK